MTDFDGDGQLDLLVTHGESAAQPISVYRVNQVSTRFLPVNKTAAKYREMHSKLKTGFSFKCERKLLYVKLLCML